MKRHDFLKKAETRTKETPSKALAVSRRWSFVVCWFWSALRKDQTWTTPCWHQGARCNVARTSGAL